MQHEIQLGLPRAGVMARAVPHHAAAMIISSFGKNGKRGAASLRRTGETGAGLSRVCSGWMVGMSPQLQLGQDRSAAILGA